MTDTKVQNTGLRAKFKQVAPTTAGMLNRAVPNSIFLTGTLTAVGAVGGFIAPSTTFTAASAAMLGAASFFAFGVALSIAIVGCSLAICTPLELGLRSKFARETAQKIKTSVIKSKPATKNTKPGTPAAA